jgi:RNA polymerase sigma factor (sigma-70 family)
MNDVICGFGIKIPKHAHDDIMQTALLKCLENHDDSYGQKFTTSLYRFTVWECRRFLRNRRNTLSLSSVPELSVTVCDRHEDVEHILECLDLISESDRSLVEQRFIMGMTLREIGALRGYTRQTAMKKVRRAVARLKRVCLRD